MERYQVGLVLVAADLDTKDVLRQFAKYPTLANRCTFEYFLRRTQLNIFWDAGLNANEADNLEKLVNLRMGSVGTQTATASLNNIDSMTDDERVALYVDLCRQSGINVTEEDIRRPFNSIENKDNTDDDR